MGNEVILQIEQHESNVEKAIAKEKELAQKKLDEYVLEQTNNVRMMKELLVAEMSEIAETVAEQGVEFKKKQSKIAKKEQSEVESRSEQGTKQAVRFIEEAFTTYVSK